MVSLTATVWIAIALWVLVAFVAYACIVVASRFDRAFAPVPPKVRKPRTRKPIDIGVRGDEPR